MHYLLKTEPSAYAFADLQRDRETIWDGVTNPQAVKYLRGMTAGARLVIYHTGDQKQAVGTASVVSVDVSDPRQPKVKIKAGKPLSRPVTLAELRSSPPFRDSPLLRQGRLSVVPLTAEQYGLIAGD